MMCIKGNALLCDNSIKDSLLMKLCKFNSIKLSIQSKMSIQVFRLIKNTAAFTAALVIPQILIKLIVKLNTELYSVYKYTNTVNK